MSFPVPKLQYNPGTGVITLPFTYPPIQKSGAPDLTAVRNDSISISGLKQTMSERVDEFLPLQMEFVPLADLPAWQDFMHFALAGGLFNYFPDHLLTHFTTYTLEDSSWTPKRNCFGISKFTIRMRKVYGPDQTGS